MGHTVEFITPLEFRTLPCPTYPGYPPVAAAGRQVTRRLATSIPDADPHRDRRPARAGGAALLR